MSESATEHVVTVYSDYVCPFCYLGRTSLERYREAATDPPAVDWHPFDLRARKRGPDREIDHDVDDGKDDAYFEQVRENVRRLADEYGVEMTLDFSREVDSWNAQQLALYARQHEDDATFAALDEAIFDALWVEGRDIGDPAVLAELAAGVGIDEGTVEDVLADETLADELEAAFAAAGRRGITGVPTFVYGDHAARGAVPPEQLERLVEG